MLFHRCMSWRPTTMGQIPSELTHRHEQRFLSEQCLLLYKERNDGGGKRTNAQGRPMDGAEVTKRCGLPSGTRWRVHLHGETWIARRDVGGATDVFMVTRQDLQTMEAEPPLMMLAALFAGVFGQLRPTPS